MRFRIFALLIMGVVLAVVAGFATFSYTRGLESRLAAAEASVAAFGETLIVPVPSRDLKQGEAFDPAEVTSLTVPLRHLPANLLRVLPIPKAGERLHALTDLPAGSLIFEHQLGVSAGPDSPFSLSPEGRAIAVRVHNLAEYGDGLPPQSSVDLFWTRNIGGGATETRLLATGLRVLAPVALQGSETRAGTASDLLLEADQITAARLLAAEQSGQFHLLPAGRLRAMGASPDEVSVGPADLAALPLVVRRADPTRGANAGAGSLALPRPCHTLVVRGAARSVQEVPC